MYFIHTFSKYLGNVYDVADTILGPRVKIMNKEYKVFTFSNLQLKAVVSDFLAHWNHLQFFLNSDT